MAEQEIGKLIIRLVAEVKDIKKSLGDVKTQVQDVAQTSTKSYQQMQGSLSTLQAAYLTAAAKIYAAYSAIKKGFEWAELGAKAEMAALSYKLVTKSMSMDGDRLISKLKEIGKVFVDETELMITTQRLVAEKFSFEDITNVMRAAVVVSRMQAVDIKEAFDMVSNAIISLQTRGIKRSFPMEQEEVWDKYARTINRTGSYLTLSQQQHAILAEIVSKLTSKEEMLGNALDTMTIDKLKRAYSAWDQLKEELGVKVALAFLTVYDAIIKTGEALDSLPSKFRKAVESVPLIGQGLIAINKLLEKGLPSLPEGMKYPEKIPSPASQAAAKSELKSIAVFDMEEIDKQAEESRKRIDELNKFRLAQEQAIIVSINEMKRSSLQASIAQSEASLEIEKIQAIANAKATNEDVTILEMSYANRKAALDRDNAIKTAALERDIVKSELAAKTAAELAEVQKSGADIVAQTAMIRTKAGIEAKAIDQKFANEEVKIRTKFGEEVGAVDAKLLQERSDAYREAVKKMQAGMEEETEFVPTTKQIAEADKRSADYTNERINEFSKIEAKLAELSGSWDAVTEVQVRQIEEERKNFKDSDARWKLSIAQMKEYDRMMDLRILKLKESRSLESAKNIADLKLQVIELKGGWEQTRQAEIDALDAQLKYAIATRDLTDEEKKLLTVVTDLQKTNAGNRELERERQLKEAILERQRIMIEMSRANLDISEAEALRQMIDLETQRRDLMKENLSLIDRTTKEGQQAYSDLSTAIAQSDATLAGLNRKLKEETGTALEGMLQGVKEWADEVKSEFQIFRDMAKDTFKSMGDAFETFFVDALGGQLKTARDYLKSFENELNRIMAKMARQQLENLFKGIFGGGTKETGKQATIFDSFLGQLKTIFTSGTTAPPIPTAQWVAKTGGGLETAADLAKSIAPATGELKKFDAEIKSKPTDIAGMVTGLTDMDGGLKTVKDSFDDISKDSLPSMMNSFDDLTRDIPDVSKEISSAIKEIDLPEIPIDSLTTEFGDFFSQTSEGVLGMTEGFTGFFENASTGIEGLGGLFGDVLGGLGDGIDDLLGSLFSGSEMNLMTWLQGGGLITKGSGMKDDVPIMGMKGEFMQPVPAVKYYGKDVMEKIRKMEISKEFFSIVDTLDPMFKSGDIPIYGEGGIVTKPHLAVVGDVPEVIIPQNKFTPEVISTLIEKFSPSRTDFAMPNAELVPMIERQISSSVGPIYVEGGDKMLSQKLHDAIEDAVVRILRDMTR